LGNETALRREESQTALYSDELDGIEGITFANLATAFPIKKRYCYLNTASLGASSVPVITAVNRFLCDVRDNGDDQKPNYWRHGDTAIKGHIARLIGAHASEIAFVKNTTEGLVAVANGFRWKSGDNLIISDIEFPSNVYCWMKLLERGVEVRRVKSVGGRILIDDLRSLIDYRTRLVSLSAVQFSNGYRQDLESTAQLCDERAILLNLDAIQWVGALEIDVERLGIHFLSAGGHKWLLGPIGTGFFYCRRSALDLLDPPSIGYHSVIKRGGDLDYDLTLRIDASRFEEAMVNFPGLWGLDAAIRMQLELGPANIERHILSLCARAAEGLSSKGYEIASPYEPAERSGILSFRHPRRAPADIAARLKAAKVVVPVRAGSLRVSPSYYNDADEIDRLLEALEAA
jgi:selenocysteine lyase/cysteine desulfurase